MAVNRLGHRIATVLCGGAIATVVGLTAACSSDTDTPDESPTSTTTTSTTTTEPSLSPTEKSVNPDATGGLTPPVTAPQPTLIPPDED